MFQKILLLIKVLKIRKKKYVSNLCMYVYKNECLLVYILENRKLCI